MAALVLLLRLCFTFGARAGDIFRPSAYHARLGRKVCVNGTDDTYCAIELIHNAPHLLEVDLLHVTWQTDELVPCHGLQKLLITWSFWRGVGVIVADGCGSRPLINTYRYFPRSSAERCASSLHKGGIDQ